jgi:phosphoenolpyruvate carboxykinase (ATP)
MNAVNDLLDPVIRAQLAILGLRWANCISWNAADAVLYQEAIARDEATVTATGGLAVTTGTHTGRSPKDKFIVCNKASAESVWWGANQAMEQVHFDRLKADMLAHARLKSLFVQDLVAGADHAHALPTRVITEHAWQALFIRHLLRKPDAAKPFLPRFNIIVLPSFRSEPARHGTHSSTVIAMDLQAGLVLIGGTHYAGEIKKAVFTILNHLLPDRAVLPMHCAANVGADNDTILFFGLSGTGKTTLSTDPVRTLVGDDEHGWSQRGIFNFEGGCYAKAINLSSESEPQIHTAASRWGTVLENVVLDRTNRIPDYADATLTQNTRLAYPLSALPRTSATGEAPHPQVIIMLTADAFGVLPPLAKLTEDQAIYHFLSGYTSKLAGTERDVAEPQATFSACFGQPFLTRHPSVYGEMLRGLIRKHQVPCYLVNTGWTGGAYGIGSRMPIAMTRRLLHAAVNGDIEEGALRRDEHFGFMVPQQVAGVDSTLLSPRQTWADASAYDKAAQNLVRMFEENYERFELSNPRIAAE